MMPLRRQSTIRARRPVAGEKQVFVDTFTKSGFTGGINWYRNMSRNWQRAAGLTTRAGAVADDHGRKRSRAAAVFGDGHEKNHSRSREILVRDSGHWTQQKSRTSQRQAGRMA